MITILAHGVPYARCPLVPDLALSPMQCRLLSDPAPIRICGAPTGSGKTYAFIQSVKATRQWVLFVVPTQALAANIAETASRDGVSTAVWDGSQYESLSAPTENIWTVRRNQLDHAAQHGGLILTTPETLGQIFLGAPYRQSVPQMSIKSLLTAKHIVFDEVHLLTERALGFLQSWMTLIAWQHQQYPGYTPHLTFLSATHSTLVSRLVGDDIPSSAVSCFDEQLITPGLEEPASSLRMLHGNVDITVAPNSVTDILTREMSRLLATHQQILVVYDSLKQYSQHARDIDDAIRLHGISPGEVFVVTGQERQSAQPLDAVQFEAGVAPKDYHRIIIGTSALEVGITYPNITAAIIDVGLTPAALIQRIGRVARSAHDGQVWVATPTQHLPSHFLTLSHLDGRTLTAEEFREPFSPYVPIDFRRARTLGSAYWSMMRASRSPAYAALKDMHGDLTERPLPGRQFGQLRHMVEELTPNMKTAYKQWLNAVDHTLQDIRGFSPTVVIKFGDREPIRCERDWALRYLREPDTVDVDKNCWVYRGSRDECLLDRPRAVQLRLIRPTLEGSLLVTWTPGFQSYGRILEEYLLAMRRSKVYSRHPIWKKTYEFIAATGLLVRDHEESVNGIELPDIDGSFQL